MSQFPTQPGQRRRQPPTFRGGGTAASQLGALPQREVPAMGQASRPPVSRGAQMANQLLQAMNQAGRTAETVDRFAAKTVADRQQEQARLDRLDQGQANLSGRMRLPELAQQAEQGELDALLDGDGSVADAVADYVDQNIPEDASPAFADQYRQVVAPALTQQMVGRQERLQDQARGEQDQLAIEAAQTAGSVKELKAVAEDRIMWRPDATESENLATVIIPVLRTAASTGDGEKFELAAAALGDRFPGEVQRQRETLAASVARKQNHDRIEVQREVQNQVDALLEPTVGADGREIPPNFDAGRETVRELLFEHMTPTQRRAAMDRIDQAEQRHDSQVRQKREQSFQSLMSGQRMDQLEQIRQREAAGDPVGYDELIANSNENVDMAMAWRGALPDAVIEQEIQGELRQLDQAQRKRSEALMRGEATAAIASGLMNPEETGGIDAVRQRLEAEGFEDGMIDEAIDTAWRGFLGDVDDAMPFDPAAVVEAARLPTGQRSAEQTQELGRFRSNLRMRLDVMSQSEDLVDPTIQRMFRGIVSRIPPDVTEEQLAERLPQADFALELFREMDSHRAVKHRHVHGEDLEFMRMASAARESLGVSWPAALVMSRQGIEQDLTMRQLRTSAVPQQQLDQAVNSATDPGFWGRRLEQIPFVFNRDVRNEGYIADQVRVRARILSIPSGGVVNEHHIEEATRLFRQDHVMLNGWAQPVGDSPLVDQIGEDGLDAAAQMIVGAHVEKLDEAEDAGNFTLIKVGDWWRVSHMDSGVPAEQSRAYTNQDIQRIAGHMMGLERAAEDRRATEAVRRRRMGWLEEAREKRQQFEGTELSILQAAPSVALDPERWIDEPPSRSLDEQFPDRPEHLADVLARVDKLAPDDRQRLSDHLRVHAGRTWDAIKQGFQNMPATTMTVFPRGSN